MDWEKAKEWAKENKPKALVMIFVTVAILAVLAEKCSG